MDGTPIGETGYVGNAEITNMVLVYKCVKSLIHSPSFHERLLLVLVSKENATKTKLPLQVNKHRRPTVIYFLPVQNCITCSPEESRKENTGDLHRIYGRLRMIDYVPVFGDGFT